MGISILLPSCAITLALLFLSPVATFGAVVLDAEGNPLVNTGAYFIYPMGPHHGTGGLTVTPVNESTPCPLSIKQKNYTLGLPVTIATPVRIRFLGTGFPLALHFNHVHTACNEALRWWVAKEDENKHQYVIVGVDSGKFKQTYFFNIEESNTEKTKYVYNIKFRHVSVSTTLTNIDEECNDVGLINGVLGIADEPLDVVFIKKGGAHEFAA